MAKRKRKTSSVQAGLHHKRAKVHETERNNTNTDSHSVAHPLLKQYYREVKTLREYVLHRLPTTSRLRRRRLAELESANVDFRHLLNHTFVGLLTTASTPALTSREQAYVEFTTTQRASRSGSATTQQTTLEDVSGSQSSYGKCSLCAGRGICNLVSLQTERSNCTKTQPHPVPWTRTLRHCIYDG